MLQILLLIFTTLIPADTLLATTVSFYKDSPIEIAQDQNPKEKMKAFMNDQQQSTDELAKILISTYQQDRGFRILNTFPELGVITAEVPRLKLYRNTLPTNIHYQKVKRLYMLEGHENILNIQEDGHYSNSLIDYKKLYPKLGSGVNLFILDTGIRITHKEFKGLHITSHQKTHDKHGHGTHVIATAAGINAGFAHKANLYIGKVISDEGYSDDTELLRGLQWVLKKCAKITGNCILSLSLGGEKDILQNKIIDQLNSLGILVIAAAGNDATNACDYSPSSAEGALTVTSANIYTYTLSGFSNHGPCVNMIADGENIIAAWKNSDDSYKSLSGTSMATPHVAGIAALIWGEHPTFTNSDLREFLITASNLWIFGYPLSI